MTKTGPTNVHPNVLQNHLTDNILQNALPKICLSVDKLHRRPQKILILFIWISIIISPLMSPRLVIIKLEPFFAISLHYINHRANYKQVWETWIGVKDSKCSYWTNYSRLILHIRGTTLIWLPSILITGTCVSCPWFGHLHHGYL